MILTNALVPIIAVNIEVMMPIDSVIAKPLTGPEPYESNITATISVVTLASQIVKNAL